MSDSGPRVSIIIPAYNEEKRIRPVLEAVMFSRVAQEVIVVSDGSEDNTLAVAQSVPGVDAIQLPHNRGKAFALLEGARRATGDVLVFLDADLIGLKPEQVAALASPLTTGRAAMSLGIFGGGRFWTDLAQRIAPNISGQRALERETFLSIPDLEDCGFGVEVAITSYVRSRRLRIERVSFAGVTHPTKEEKLGVFRGEWERLRMYGQIAAFKLRYHRRRPRILTRSHIRLSQLSHRIVDSGMRTPREVNREDESEYLDIGSRR